MFQNSNLGDVAIEAGWQRLFSLFSSPFGSFFISCRQNYANASWEVYTSSQSTKNILFGEYSNTNADGPRVSWAQTLSSAVKITSLLPKYKDWVDAAFVGVSYPV